MNGTGEPIRYTLTFTDPASHLVEVEASFPTGGQPQVELVQPVWTPGSYKVRDYSRQVEGVRAESPGGNALPVVKTRKNRWSVTTWGAPRVHVGYRVYCREMTVRTNFVDASFALLNGAPTFLTLDEPGPRPHEVDVVLPGGWREIHTALAPSPQKGPHAFVAPDFATLVDSPIYCGSPETYPFEIAGVPHLLVDEGEAGVWDGPRAAADCVRIVEAAVRLWGGLPYPRYLVLNLVTEAGGGLEHRDCTVLMTSRWKTRKRESYLEWLSLVAHEHFHAWNVKRLVPRELVRPDLEEENYTRSLWVAEGITSYYDDLLVHRAGLSTRDEYLRELAKTIRAAQKTPGRRTQTLADASFDTWIKFYQPDENTPNSAISYYVKGGTVAFLLDARIRRASDGARSLDDLLRAAWERFAGERGYAPEEIEALAAEIAGEDLTAFFDRALRSTDELDFTEVLEWWGLRFADEAKKPVEPTAIPPAEKAGWLGATTKADGGRLVVTEVRRGTPAHDAGLAPEDELLAIDDLRVPPEKLGERLGMYRPGDGVELLVARRERLLRLDARLGEDPGEGWKLEVRPDASAEQKARLAAWLAG
jgi:predicted metalloprotease with PDZ domain